MKQFIIFVCSLAALFLMAVGFISGWDIMEWIGAAEPLPVIIVLAASAVMTSFLFGLMTGDHSWVDRLWSTLPVVFSWIYAVKKNSTLLLVLAVIITAWGSRLSFNFARKGGYSGVEDYRWVILRERIRSPFLWQLFHLLFICFYQISLFVLFTLPLNDIFRKAAPKYSIMFAILALLMLCALTLEWIADQQQWEFHKDKRGAGKGRFLSDVRRGFLSSGLFAFSRHPNYFGELSFWWVLYLCSVSVTGSFINPGMAGPILLTFLFAGSTRFTESITSTKYPEYEAYRKCTSPIFPFPPRERTGMFDGTEVENRD